MKISYTFVPFPADLYTTGLARRLTGASLLLLGYLIQQVGRTGKERVFLADDDLLRGRKDIDGRRLDVGCGIGSRTTLYKARESLESQKLIVVSDASNGHYYSVRFDRFSSRRDYSASETGPNCSETRPPETEIEQRSAENERVIKKENIKRVDSVDKESHSPTDRDVRFETVRSAIVNLQRATVGYDIWDDKSTDALWRLLNLRRSASAQDLVRCVVHRWASADQNNAEHPGKWLMRLTEYQNTPLNKWGDPVMAPDSELLRLNCLAEGVKFNQCCDSGREETPTKPCPTFVDVLIERGTSSLGDESIASDAWARISLEMKKRMSELSWSTWIQPLKQSSVQNGLLQVQVPTTDFLELATKFRMQILEATKSADVQLAGLRFIAVQ
jgi:hypothetical protein